MNFDKLVKECGVGMTGISTGPTQMAPGPVSQNDDYQAEAENMINSQLHSLSTNTERLKSLVANFDELEPWVQSKITLAEDYISTITHYLEYEAGTWVQSKITLAEDYISTITHYLEYEAGKHQETGQMSPPTPVVAIVKPRLGTMMAKF
jgi:hypothetical protein